MFKIITAATIFLMATNASAFNVFNEVGKVVKVVDGDTLVVEANQRLYSGLSIIANSRSRSLKSRYGTITIRVANINTPESVHRDESKNTVEGVVASNFAKKLLSQGDYVTLSCWDVGKYGRAICSVDKNGSDFGLAMIRGGHSEYITCFGKHPVQHERYKKAAGGRESCPYK